MDLNEIFPGIFNNSRNLMCDTSIRPNVGAFALLSECKTMDGNGAKDEQLL